MEDTPAPNPEIEALTRDARRWAAFAGLSFFLGLAMLVGPIAWWRAVRIKQKLDAFGAPDPSAAQLAILVSAAVTLVSYFGFVFLTLVLLSVLRHGTY